MARQYPSNIRHRLAFQAWYSAGRKVTADVLKAAKRSDRHTVSGWAKAERWKEFADSLDAEATAVMAEAHVERVSRYEEVKAWFQEQRLEMLRAGGAFTGGMAKRLLEHLMKGNDVDTRELKEWMQAFDHFERAGERIFDLANPERIEVNLTAEEEAAVDAVFDAVMNGQKNGKRPTATA